MSKDASHRTALTLVGTTSVAAVAALAAVLGGALVCGSANAGVFQYSAHIDDYAIQTGYFSFDLFLPKYSGPGEVAKVTLAIEGESGGTVDFGSADFIPPFDTSWSVSLFNVTAEMPVVTVTLSSHFDGCGEGSCLSPIVAFGPLPFSVQADVSDLSDFQGAGSNEFILDVNSGDFDRIFGNATVTEMIFTVPEPATWAMMLVGFAGLGSVAMLRRWKTAPSVA